MALGGSPPLGALFLYLSNCKVTPCPPVSSSKSRGSAAPAGHGSLPLPALGSAGPHAELLQAERGASSFLHATGFAIGQRYAAVLAAAPSGSRLAARGWVVHRRWGTTGRVAHTRGRHGPTQFGVKDENLDRRLRRSSFVDTHPWQHSSGTLAKY